MTMKKWLGPAVLASLGGLTLVEASITQGRDPLDALTVPAAQLPDPCRLRVSDPPAAAGGRLRVAPPIHAAITANPWSGSDPAAVGAIRGRIDPPARWPDGPPPNAQERAALQRNMADGVEAGYLAVYEAGESSYVEVHAIRFATDASFTNATMRRPKGAVTRLTWDRTIVHVNGTGGPCQMAVADHVRAVSRR